MNGSEGITEAHRGTWSRLTRLHSATTAMPTRALRSTDLEHGPEDLRPR